jgi:hypothetical protein
MRVGCVLIHVSVLECGVVGKYCSNVLRSLHAYGVVLKTVIYTCAHMHANIPTTSTRAFLERGIARA